MPQDLPGLYFDADKNRYFPIRGPIPGSARNSSSAASNTAPSSSTANASNSVSKPNLSNNSSRRIKIKAAKLLQDRELYGNVITSRKGKCNFQEEYHKMQASQPLVWKYNETERIADGALEEAHIGVHTPDGLIETDLLLAGSTNGSLSLYEVSKVAQLFHSGIEHAPDCVWPLTSETQGFVEEPIRLWRTPIASIHLSSNVSCIKMFGKYLDTHGSASQHVLITTLGSETSGGSVHVLNLREPIDYILGASLLRLRIYNVATSNCTVWTADCNSDGSQAVVGTNLGASLINLETGAKSWVFRCKSDAMAVQLHGQVVLCGLRNGAIVTVDTRQRSDGRSDRLTRHRISHQSHEIPKSSRTPQNSSKQWFELKGNILHSHIISMPSSISCLASLQMYDQYFLASSMDGSIRLYDHRIIQRGPVQCYEGNVNTHTRIQLAVDPDERILMSGGEDCKIRLWSIKSGHLLFEEKFMNTVPSTMCRRMQPPTVARDNCRYYSYGQDLGLGCWVGSREGIFCMRWL
ncbi:uncharacterized protein LOC127808690 isoform X2 [Diospyros lotus]|uniref:uncharacterized protein LOC127808690 isoform X2 n=1 Tax=Diospyros lotus TaxID=55363 RepID=UPI002252405E|nr:uncharacterized protein LOC127808690 isoform X2 [Diospyros lotus]